MDVSDLIFILEGVPLGVFVSVSSFFIGFCLGVPFAFVRAYMSKPYQLMVDAYEKVFRGIPEIVMMLLFYFGIGLEAGVKPFDDMLWAAALALGLRSGANQSQIFRGAIRGVGEGQIIAARSLGLSKLKAIWHVIIPQTFMVATPGLGSEYALLIKDSAYCYILGIMEIMKRAAIVRLATLDAVYPFVASAFIYVSLTCPVATYLDKWGSRKKKQYGI